MDGLFVTNYFALVATLGVEVGDSRRISDHFRESIKYTTNE